LNWEKVECILEDLAESHRTSGLSAIKLRFDAHLSIHCTDALST